MWVVCAQNKAPTDRESCRGFERGPVYVGPTLFGLLKPRLTRSTTPLTARTHNRRVHSALGYCTGSSCRGETWCATLSTPAHSIGSPLLATAFLGTLGFVQLLELNDRCSLGSGSVLTSFRRSHHLGPISNHTMHQDIFTSVQDSSALDIGRAGLGLVLSCY